MKKLILFLTILSISSISHSQDPRRIGGTIMNEKNERLAGAVITCVSLPDSTAVSYAVTGDDGRYDIKVPSHGGSVLEVTYIGYEKQIVAVSSSGVDIRLKASVNDMGDVTVKARSTVEKKAGKLIFSPLSSDFVKGIDSYEMLKYTPLITLQDNIIKMIGNRNVTIYINGRLPVMGQSAVMDMLRSTPAENIKRIEVITAPTAAYKASMSGGVLNIVIVSPNDGFSGSATASLAYKYERFSPNASVYMAYSKNKFRTSASLWGYNRNGLEKSPSEYDYKTTGVFVTNSEVQKKSYAGGGGNLNLEYDINDRNNLGASVSLYAYDYWYDGTVMSEYKKYGSLDYYLKAVNSTRTPILKPYIGSTVYYKLKTDDLGSNLDISASYNRSYSNTVNSMEYLKRLPGNAYERTEMFRQIPTQNIQGYEFKAAYSHYFKDESLLQAGLQSNLTHIDNDFVRENWNGTEYVNDPLQSNLFVYDESVNALFVNYERQWSDVFSSTIGLRGEHTYIKADQKTNEESFERSYFNLFPQLSLNFDFDEGDHNLSVDMGKSISRPFYSKLNTFKIWTSPNTYTVGNTNLEAGIDYNASAMYILKNDYTFGVDYYFFKNSSSDYIGPGPEGGNTTITSTYNYGHGHQTTFFAEVRKNFFNDIWRPSLSVNVYNTIEVGEINGLDIGFNSWEWGVNFTNIIRLSQKRQIDVMVQYFYESAVKAVSRNWSAEHLLFISFVKHFKFGGTLSITANDLLDSKSKTSYNTDTYSYWIRDPFGMYFTISYSQRFGNYRVRGAKNSTSRTMDSRIGK